MEHTKFRVQNTCSMTKDKGDFYLRIMSRLFFFLMKFKIFFRKREDIVEVNIFFETEIFLRKFKVSKKKEKKSRREMIKVKMI